MTTKRRTATDTLARTVDFVRANYRLRYNDFAQRVETEAGAAWDDVADIRCATHAQREGVPASALIAGQAVQLVSRDNPFHPVRVYLDTVARNWDGAARIENWIADYFGAEANDYTRAIGPKILIGGVARIMRPGCKLDTMPVLEAPQGAGKGRALRILGGEFFADELAEFGSKDAALQLAGAWILEVSELHAMRRGEIERIKAFLSRSHDRYRPPYGRNVIERPRQCILIGSTNAQTYLADETGGRRFWPIACCRIDLDRLAADRNQLWGEAVHRFREGESWWLDNGAHSRAAKAEQRDRYAEDVWAPLIEEYVNTTTSDSISIGDVLREKIGRQPAEWTQADQNRVARCLVHLGFERRRLSVGGRREWRYSRSVPVEGDCPSVGNETGTPSEARIV